MRTFGMTSQKVRNCFGFYAHSKFDYRFFLFAQFPVIKPFFSVESIQLRTNLSPLFLAELRQCFEDLRLNHGQEDVQGHL